MHSGVSRVSGVGMKRNIQVHIAGLYQPVINEYYRVVAQPPSRPVTGGCRQLVSKNMWTTSVKTPFSK